MPIRDGLAVVLGAGPVGRALVSRLREAERSVRLVTRSGRPTAPGAENLTADVSVSDDAVRACAGAAVVYACVGFDYRDWPTRWPPVMAGMLDGAEAARARLVFMDNMYMYGPIHQTLTEDLPLSHFGRKPATRAAVTRVWQQAYKDGRVRVAAVRASDFYGPGVTNAALGATSFGRIARGKSAQVVGDIDQPHSFTYVPDIARALMTIGEADESVIGEAWHVPNAPDRTMRDLLQMFADASGQKLRISVLPPSLHSLLGLFDGNLRELKEMMYQWTDAFHVDHDKFATRFWANPTPFEEGIRATAEWYGRQ